MAAMTHNWGIRGNLAAQLFTVRDHTRTASELAETLTKISRIGYLGVQFSAVSAMDGDTPSVSPKFAKQLLDDNGLTCVATHRPWKNLVQSLEKEIELHKTISCNYLAVGGIPSEYASDGLAGYIRWTDEARVVANKLNEFGITFAYHNHDFEFERAGADRKFLYSVFVERGAPILSLELDVYWAQHAGIDPVALIEKLSGRLAVAHVKDKEIRDGKPVMAPVGEGNLNWERIIPALKNAGTEWLCVEQDEYYRDPFSCLKSSFDYLCS